jgi:hypothetical protein
MHRQKDEEAERFKGRQRERKRERENNPKSYIHNRQTNRDRKE